MASLNDDQQIIAQNYYAQIIFKFKFINKDLNQ